MAVSIVGTPTTFGGDFGSSIPISKPSGLSSPDACVVIVAAHNVGNCADDNAAFPFTEVGQFHLGSGFHTIYVRQLTGIEGSTLNFLLDFATARTAIAFGLRGVYVPDLWDVSPATGESGADASPTCPGITTTIADTIALAVCSIMEFGTSKTITGGPDGWTEIATYNTANHIPTSIYWRSRAAIGATGDAGFATSASATTTAMSVFNVKPHKRWILR